MKINDHLPTVSQHSTDNRGVRGVPTIITDSAPFVEGINLHPTLVSAVSTNQSDRRCPGDGG